MELETTLIIELFTRVFKYMGFKLIINNKVYNSYSISDVQFLNNKHDHISNIKIMCEVVIPLTE